jgi:DNA primase large subunit
MCKSQKFGIAGMVIGLVSIAYTIYVQTRGDRSYSLVAGLIGDSINKTSDDIKVEISEAIVEQATIKAVNREVEKIVKVASTNTEYAIRKDIYNEVKQAVDSSFTDVRKAVSDEVSRQVANIDMSRLKAEVKEKAKDLVIAKFDENLDSLLQDFNQSLSNVRKIYDSIADSVTKKPENVFRIGN